MFKKLLMFLLAGLFLISVIVLIFLFRRGRLPISTQTSVVLPSPLPTLFATITPYSSEASLILEDLKAIKQDLQKMKHEDERFSLPTFIFDLNLK